MMSRKLRGRALKAGAVGLAGAAAFVAVGAASSSFEPVLSNVPAANEKAAGYAPAAELSPELQQIAWARGSTKLEHPQGIIGFYGYENDVVSSDDPALPQMVPTPQRPDEAVKTEPDKNTYLVFRRGLTGPDPSYDYGTHFLYQGHENAAKDTSADRNPLGSITRINLDADAAHRVTLLASTDTDGKPIATIDGSTWDPWARRLIFTTESTTRPTYAATASYPSRVEDVSGALGRGGYEGVQDDAHGNLWIVEDIGGPNKQGTTAKQPNSFVYRYVPRRRGDLHHGRLQALQVLNRSGQPITLGSEAALLAPDQVQLHSYGNQLDTRWVLVHDTATDGSAPFNANAAAKAAHATPFKRPENGVFRPGSRFTEFLFDETGDTNATSLENGDRATGAGGAGGWGAIQRLVQESPSAETGKLMLLYRGNEAHSGLDNVAFLSRDRIAFVEDAGDTLHGQRNALDSGYVFDLGVDYSDQGNQPVRWLAQGRDASATIDAANAGFGKNDGDNEITGLHVSNGDPSPRGILGARVPALFRSGWRWFYTQQHGDNLTYEVIRAARLGREGEQDR
ncbi:MAG: phosphatase [Actinomycetota bacterium]|nr:phosphatase [Actinomycetota bacterium]